MLLNKDDLNFLQFYMEEKIEKGIRKTDSVEEYVLEYIKKEADNTIRYILEDYFEISIKDLQRYINRCKKSRELMALDWKEISRATYQRIKNTPMVCGYTFGYTHPDYPGKEWVILNLSGDYRLNLLVV